MLHSITSPVAIYHNIIYSGKFSRGPIFMVFVDDLRLTAKIKPAK